ncbi:MAG: xanthine dehydrogenase accessory protein XdhC [Alphaproteobacteria bacterium]|nr:xanthine dehydrogenase accessory protein XdhC [Alphaproteobacteria bacterium]
MRRARRRRARRSSSTRRRRPKRSCARSADDGDGREGVAAGRDDDDRGTTRVAPRLRTRLDGPPAVSDPSPPPAQLDWLEALGAARAAGESCVLVTVAEAKGSSPRESGAKMLVRADGRFAGSIGGGHLEHQALARAAALIAAGDPAPRLEPLALGAQLGQCCGGRVTLLYEVFVAAGRVLALFGAGHVGKEVVAVLEGLPLRIRWIDSRADQFPAAARPGVETLVAPHPADEVRDLPAGALLVAMTHSHDLDLAIAEQALRRGDLAYVGVIGSATKAARFRARLAAKGIDAGALHCPIGVPGLKAKHPRAVAVALAAELLPLLGPI